MLGGGRRAGILAWIQVLRARLARSDAEQRASILGAEATPQVAQDIAQLLPERRATHASTPRPPGLQLTDSEQARFQLFESVITVLKNVASIGPLVIVIDDLHDTDHPSLLLLKFIAGQSKEARILLGGSYRDTEVRQSQVLSRLIGELSKAEQVEAYRGPPHYFCGGYSTCCGRASAISSHAAFEPVKM